MKKLFILTIVILQSLGSFAQRHETVYAQPVNAIVQNSGGDMHTGRTTGVGSTYTLKNISDTLPTTLYRVGADSGYVTGTDYWGDVAFAELYNFNGLDSSMQVIGAMALFGGTVNPVSTKTVTFTVWDQGPQQLITGTTFYNGFPNNVLDSFSVPITQLGIGATSDTLKTYLFTTPTWGINGPFFAGYSINYNFLTLSGDTIGLASSYNGFRNPVGLYTLSYNVSDFGDTTLDTIVNVQNATMESDNNWYDNYSQNDSLLNNLAIYPIVVIGTPIAAHTQGITRNNFTFYGNYPNPAVNSTNITFSLTTGADVTVQVMDMNGKVLNTIKQNNLPAGDHTIPVNTATMPAGDYLYLIRTSGGDGIASKMSVIR